MKKSILSLLLMFMGIGTTVQAQNFCFIRNASFETWIDKDTMETFMGDTVYYDHPENWDVFFPPANFKDEFWVKSNQAAHLQYALDIKTDATGEGAAIFGFAGPCMKNKLPSRIQGKFKNSGIITDSLALALVFIDDNFEAYGGANFIFPASAGWNNFSANIQMDSMPQNDTLLALILAGPVSDQGNRPNLTLSLDELEFVFGPAGIESQESIGLFSKIIVTPNPARNIIRLDGIENQTIQAFAINARQTFQLRTNGSGEAQIEFLPQGSYIVTVIQDGRIRTGTFIKQ